MNITFAKYIADPYTGNNSIIKVTIDGVTMSVPLENGNRHYDEIMRQVELGTITVQPADE